MFSLVPRSHDVMTQNAMHHREIQACLGEREFLFAREKDGGRHAAAQNENSFYFFRVSGSHNFIASTAFLSFSFRNSSNMVALSSRYFSAASSFFSSVCLARKGGRINNHFLQVTWDPFLLPLQFLLVSGSHPSLFPVSTAPETSPSFWPRSLQGPPSQYVCLSSWPTQTVCLHGYSPPCLHLLHQNDRE